MLLRLLKRVVQIHTQGPFDVERYGRDLRILCINLLNRFIDSIFGALWNYPNMKLSRYENIWTVVHFIRLYETPKNLDQKIFGNLFYFRHIKEKFKKINQCKIIHILRQLNNANDSGTKLSRHVHFTQRIHRNYCIEILTNQFNICIFTQKLFFNVRLSRCYRVLISYLEKCTVPIFAALSGPGVKPGRR